MFNVLRKSQLEKIEVELAGLNAQLAATKQFFSRVSAPGYIITEGIIYDLTHLPRKIAELEARKQQLKGEL